MLAALGHVLERAVPGARGGRGHRQQAVQRGRPERAGAVPGDVQVVVDGLLYILKQRLQKGETVQLGDLGHFQAVIGSKGTKLEADFNASLIKRPRIVFRPSVTLKSVTGLAKFEKIVPDAPAPGGGDSESPDEI